MVALVVRTAALVLFLMKEHVYLTSPAPSSSSAARQVTLPGAGKTPTTLAEVADLAATVVAGNGGIAQLQHIQS